MIKFIRNFRKDEDGAVTVDWVVLTAAVVALAGAAYTSIEGGTTALTGAISTELSGIDVDAGGGGGGGGGDGGGDGGG